MVRAGTQAQQVSAAPGRVRAIGGGTVGSPTNPEMGFDASGIGDEEAAFRP
jgi:hypothetical protein